jgi:GNAT superfamily N-acetyltransferase
MLENLIIRPIEMKDAQQFRDSLYTRDTLEQIETLINDNIQKAADNQWLHIVADLDGEIVGTAIIMRNTRGLKQHRAELAGLVVKYEYWGKGIAHRLVDECKKLALGMGIEILEVGCRGGEPAEQIYKHLGFTEYSRLAGGLKEPWEEQKVFDEVNLYLPLLEGKAK